MNDGERDGPPPGGLEERLARLKQKMEAGLPERARELRESVERYRAGAREELVALRRHGHKLRGVAGSYGYDGLTEIASALEEMAVRVQALADQAGEADVAAVIARADALAQAIDAVGAAPKPKPETGPVPERPSSIGLLAGLRIAAADDDDATRKLLGLTLKQVGKADAEVVDSGAALLAVLAQGPHDIIICDAMMPEMNGLDFLQAVVAQGLGEQARCFAILSAASVDELGWLLPPTLHVAWLRKPFRPQELVQQLVARVR